MLRKTFGPKTDEVAVEEEEHARFWWKHLRERDNFEDIDVNGRIILKRALKNSDGKAWSEFIWLRIGTGGGLL